MTNKESILEFLEANAPGGYCDDCLSEQLHIEPRQQVNQLCNGLAHQMRLARAKANCVGCGRNKTCNTLTAVPGEMLGELKATLYRRTSDALEVETPVSMEMRLEQDPSKAIVANWQRVLWFCRSLWEEKHGSECTLGLADLIDELGDMGVLRRHEAIMMHTIRLLRNECLYDGFAVRPLDARVSCAALKVIASWAENREPALWRKAGPSVGEAQAR
ncbi:MAG: hypothetical protein BWY10_01517 [Chloroflexi bacterium ADurb.Bin180]|nr:MAG: hypothetical protein BWY10_01517 [Chloroflexi bacterium ADurb.Bin180]